MALGLSASVAVFVRMGGFLATDFISLAEAQREGLSIDYLLRPVFGHFVPGHRFVNWFVQAVSPLNFRLTSAVLLLCFAASLLVMHRLLAELFRPGPGPLLLTLFYGASIIQLGTAQWWAAGLSRLPAQVFMLLAILLHLRFRRTSRLRYLIWSVASVGIAILFSEDAFLLVVFLVAIRILILDPGERVLESVRNALAEWRIWLLYLIPLAVSFVGATTQTGTLLDVQSPVSLLRYLGTAWFQSLSPALAGQLVNEGPLSAAEVAIVVIVQLALAVAIGWSVKRRPVAWRAWLFLAVGFLVTQVPVGLLRTGGYFSPEVVAHELRYFSVGIALVTIALGAAFLPVRAEQLARRTSAGVWVSQLSVPRVAIGALALLYVGCSLWSSTRLARQFEGRHSRRYVNALRADLRELQESSERFALLDDEVPPFVIPRFLAPYNRVSWVAEPLGEPVSFSASSGNLYRATADGHLEPVVFTPHIGGSIPNLVGRKLLAVRAAQARSINEGKLCLRSGDRHTAIGYPLAAPLGAGEWYLSISYTTRASGAGGVLVNRGNGFLPGPDPAFPFLAARAEGIVYLGNGAGVSGVAVLLPNKQVTIDGEVLPGSDVCLGQLSLGMLQPRP
jgi:hypothetical protein